MATFKYYFILTFVIVALLSCSTIPVSSKSLESDYPSLSIPAKQYAGDEFLDGENKFQLSWNISDAEKTIYFEVTVETLGFVGFGISPNGGMTGADILIAGLHPNGTEYHLDSHAVGFSTPIEDASSDWVVTFTEETATHTKLKFHRLLNTCDEDDIEITDGTMRLIWAMGETDEIRQHAPNKRGTKSVNFYLQEGSEFQPGKYENLTLTVDMVMPAQQTAYWCSIHEAPVFNTKQHIVSFEAVIENAAALQHLHHFIMYRCIAPEGQDPDKIFGPWVIQKHPGDYCYVPSNESFPFLQYCTRYINYIWSKGGKRLEFPENMGLPVPEVLGRREYYALEIHYDNPESTANVKFSTGARMYYTSELREQEVGLLLINHNVDPSLLVPPQVSDYIVTGHCSPQCTEKYLPSDGITIFNNLFHSHLAGRKLKLRHFRGDQELSWIDVDEYYDFDFQQNKPLTRPRKIERGDQLTVECTYDSMNAPGKKAVLGGLSTHDEMCDAIVYYYPRQELSFCGSTQNLTEHFKLLGITEYKMKESPIPGTSPEYEILTPENLKGDLVETLSYKVSWTREFLENVQNVNRYGEHLGSCFGNGDNLSGQPVKYPKVDEYVPPNQCDHAPGRSGSKSFIFHNLFLVASLLSSLCYLR